MRVLIQERLGEFANVNVLTAYLGFVEKGYEIEFVAFEAFELRPLQAGDIVVGGIPLVVRALERLGVQRPGLVSIPQSIAS